MFNYYKVSLDKLRELLETQQDLSEESWNEYANQNGLFSSISMMAIADITNWKELICQIKENRGII